MHLGRGFRLHLSPESQFPLENHHSRDWGSNRGDDVLCVSPFRVQMLKPLSLSDSSSGVSIPREQELGDGEIGRSSEFWKARGRAQRQIFDYTHLSAYHHSLGTWLADFCAVSRHMNPLSPLILPNDLTAWPVFSVSNLHMCFSNSVVVMGLREEACLKPMCLLCCFLGIFSPCLSDFLH